VKGNSALLGPQRVLLLRRNNETPALAWCHISDREGSRVFTDSLILSTAPECHVNTGYWCCFRQAQSMAFVEGEVIKNELCFYILMKCSDFLPPLRG